jgi:hypothetical protein
MVSNSIHAFTLQSSVLRYVAYVQRAFQSLQIVSIIAIFTYVSGWPDEFVKKIAYIDAQTISCRIYYIHFTEEKVAQIHTYST